MTARVLIAFDKFKGALTADEACEIARGVLARQRPEWHLDVAPLSDGGDGFSSILTRAASGRSQHVTASGPRFDGATALEQVGAPIGWVKWRELPPGARELLALPSPEPEQLAVLDLASVNGLARVPPSRRDVWRASSYGTGELIAAAADAGAEALLLGVGGSATSDLGLGALCALGIRFEDARGRALHPPLPIDWPRIARVHGRARPLPPLRIACDVDNPLFGPSGTAAVYGPQKGLSVDELPRFESAARRVAELLCRALEVDLTLEHAPGAGAAGGIAFGLMAAAGARLVPGFELVSRWCELRARIEAADYVITGEGRFDASSWSGKGPGALLTTAAELGRASVVFAGSVASDALRAGFRMVAISPPEEPLERAIRASAIHLEAAIEQWLGD